MTGVFCGSPRGLFAFRDEWVDVGNGTLELEVLCADEVDAMRVGVSAVQNTEGRSCIELCREFCWKLRDEGVGGHKDS